MASFRVIDKAGWPRREMFDFYMGFDCPCFSMSVSLEGARLYECAKDRGESFFLLALYAVLRAANSVPQLRRRVLGDDIVEFEHIAAMTPIMTPSIDGEEMFRQVWCDYAPMFPQFAAESAPKVEAAKHNAPSPMLERGDDFISANCNPWAHFTSIAQAHYSFSQSIPILAWGKLKNGLIPVSCKFNHAFVDGVHAGRFFSHMEKSFANPETLWECD